MKVRIYDLVKSLLEEYPALRDSDKKLIWSVWIKTGFIKYDQSRHLDYISLRDFMDAPSTESIRRARQLIQARHPELRGSESVTAKRKEKEVTKSTWVYREVVTEQPKLI